MEKRLSFWVTPALAVCEITAKLWKKINKTLLHERDEYELISYATVTGQTRLHHAQTYPMVN